MVRGAGSNYLNELDDVDNTIGPLALCVATCYARASECAYAYSMLLSCCSNFTT